MIDLQKQKEKLEIEERMLIDELSGLGVYDKINEDWEATSVPPLQNDVSDENDLADISEDFEERSSTLSILEERFKDVKDALKKIESGTYGICEVTGEQIEEDRLIANPAARTKKSVMNSL